MAEIATIARPYAEALFKATAGGERAGLAAEVQALANVVGNAQLRQFADSPKVTAAQTYDLIASIAGGSVSAKAQNLLRLMIDNGRLSALPDVAAQFHELVNAHSGVSDAVIHSAYPIEPAQLGEVVATLENRFGRKLNPSVVLAPELIGGIRVVVGDEVLDTSVQARLEQMRVALMA